LLIEGMMAEHRAIGRLVTELEAAGTAVDAAGAARALLALFDVHVGKENALVLPLLLASDDVSLATVLGGMHDLIGAGAADGGGCGCGGDHGHEDAEPAPAAIRRGLRAEHEAMLSVDARIDVRSLPHAQRHATVLAAISQLPADGALVLIAPHAPMPLLAEIDRRFPGQIDGEWLQEGPDVWQVRLHRQFVAA
jgi:uncharacterized protein (DUF2249 family)